MAVAGDYAYVADGGGGLAIFDFCALTAPVLWSVDYLNGNDNYLVDWSRFCGATGYTLQEDDNPSFTSPTTRYNGPNTYLNITGQPLGTWYYRVKASSAAGDSPWSDSQSVQVKAWAYLPTVLSNHHR